MLELSVQFGATSVSAFPAQETSFVAEKIRC